MDADGSVISGQMGISHQAVEASYWWAFHDVKMRALETGYKSTAAGGGSMSSQWTSCKWQNCNIGMDITGTQHMGSNLYFQGASAVGTSGIGGGYFNSSNIIGEMHVTSTNSQTVLIDSGATSNSFQPVINSFANCGIWNGVVNNGGVTNSYTDLT